MDGVALKPLTVDFHEPGFVSRLGIENDFGFWFQLSGNEQQQLGSVWGPYNPQVLNRYSYTQNNPVRYIDSTGHVLCADAMSAPTCIAVAGAAAGAAGTGTAIAVGTAVGGIGLLAAGYLWAMQEPLPAYEVPTNYAVPEGDVTGIRATVPDGTGLGTTLTLDASPPVFAASSNLPWRDLSPFRGKTKTNGKSGKDRRYYERDHTHGDVEVYDSRGNHLGSMDPETGEMTKPPVPGRKINV